MSVLVLGHKNPDTDSIISALAATELLKARGIDAEAGAQGAPNPETACVLKRFGLAAPQVVESVAGRQLYLTDYSDLAQAPADLKDAELLGIFDHHKLGDVTSAVPPEVWIQPWGCSCTVLHTVFKYYKVAIPGALAGAMLAAIISDTVMFKSPTTTAQDKLAADELAVLAGSPDLKELAQEMFRAKSNLSEPPRALLMRDFKDFEMGGHKIGIGQLELLSLEMVSTELRAELQAELDKIRAEVRHSAMLLLTDIMAEGSELLLSSEEPERILKALNAAPGKSWLPGVLSRKKQIVPPLEHSLKD